MKNPTKITPEHTNHSKKQQKIHYINIPKLTHRKKLPPPVNLSTKLPLKPTLKTHVQTRTQYTHKHSIEY